MNHELKPALPGYLCEDCQTVMLADEVVKSEVDTRDGPATEYRCVKCRRDNLDPIGVCPHCEVRRSAEGYDECLPCARFVDERLLDADLKRQVDRRASDFTEVLADIARSII